jgi:ubiquinone/menaquinone biosynthesis C-methylase UbiE
MIRRWIQERAFSALYGPAAPFYDHFTRWLFLGEWERWQQAVLPFLPEAGLVVELGPGTGLLARRGATPARRWIGVESSRSMLHIAIRQDNWLGPTFVRADARRLPIRTASADAIVATFPANFIVDPRTSEEVKRVLRPSGRLIVVLSGSLAAHGPRHFLRRIALQLFYGRLHGRDVEVSRLAGIEGRLCRVPTEHGVATLFVGSREPATYG